MAAPALEDVREVPAAYPSIETPPADARPGPPVPLHSSHSIARKPVPGRSLPIPPVPVMDHPTSDPSSPDSVVNDESWEGGLIDEDALERVLNAPDRKGTMHSSTTESSVPDYASTISNHSSPPKKSVERPRAGKLKTVGDPDIPSIDPRSGGAGRLDTWEADQVEQSKEIPGVDFGPTYAYKPSSRPGTSGTLTPGEMANRRRSRSADRLSAMMSGTMGASARPSPNEANRLSYFSNAGRTTPSPGRMTPEFGGPGDRRSMTPGRQTPEFGAAGNRSSMVWQPAPATGRVTPEPGAGINRSSTMAWQPAAPASPGPLHRSRTSVTPEQWVQERAAMAHQQNQYAAPQRKGLPNIFHSRSNSAQGQRKLTKTPPLGRTLSGDWTQQAKRTPPPERPSSRGAGVNLDTAGASLSAREQMQVSRATGTPLLNLASNGNKQPRVEQPGMIGYVAARERDKAASREGRNSVAVQQAILERQQQQQRMEAEAYAQQQYQAQLQAAQAAQYAQHQQQMQQQSQMQQQYNTLVMQNAQMEQQGQMAAPYGGAQAQDRPLVQNRNSWQQLGMSPQPQYPGQQNYNPQASPGQQQGYQQPYGAAYFGQSQGQQRRG